MSEPRLVYCAQRVSGDEEEIDIECRFDDGQKYTAIRVVSDNPMLADVIVNLLNAYAKGRFDKTTDW